MIAVLAVTNLNLAGDSVPGPILERQRSLMGFGVAKGACYRDGCNVVPESAYSNGLPVNESEAKP